MMTVGCILKHCLTKSLLPLLMLVSLAAWAEEQFVLIDVKKIDDIFHYSTLNQDGTTSEFRRRNLNSVVDTVTQHTNDENHGHGDDYVLWRDYLSKPHPTVNTLKTYFLQASNEFGVPVEILEAIGQIESNWTHIGPSIDKGWGIMHLVQNEYADTLNEAARLLNVDQQILKDDAQQNIRGAAALIALYAGEARKSFTKLEDWFSAIAQFSGLFDSDLQKMQARNYYKKIKAGGVSSTLWGEQIVLNPNPSVEIPPDPQLTRRNSTSVDYAEAIPSFTSYNYTSYSNRSIKAWVNHWIGTGTVAGALSRFKSSTGGASAHFIVSKEGEIYQVVRVKDMAWHAGDNMGYNPISIGVEHEVTVGGMSGGVAWNTAWTEPLLRASAKMAKYFIDLYGIPQNHSTVDRVTTLQSGIFGHSQLKSTSCPGTFPWDTWMSYLSSSSSNLEVYDLWAKQPAYANANSSSSNPNFDAQFKVRNAGSQSITIQTLALAIHYSNGDFGFDLTVPYSSQAKYVNNLTLQPNQTYHFELATGYFKSAGTYKLVAKANLNGNWKNLKEIDFTIQPQQQSSSTFDGAGSLIKPSISCWGCDKDEATMHPSNNASTVAFQWMNDGNCPYLNIREPSGLKAVVSSKGWDDAYNVNSYLVTLPVTIPNSGMYTTTSVTSISPVSSSTGIRAYCSTTDSNSGNRSSSSNIDTTFSNGYTWVGNGSIISADTGSCSDFGCNKDWAIAHSSKNALTAFQWQVSSRCQTLRIQVNGGGSFSGRLKYKDWNSPSWEYDNYASFPKDITKTSSGNYFVFAIETSAGTIPSGKYIEAICK